MFKCLLNFGDKQKLWMDMKLVHKKKNTTKLQNKIITLCSWAARTWNNLFAETANESGRHFLLSVATGTNTGSRRTGEAALPWNIHHFQRYALVNPLLLFAQWPWQKVWCSLGRKTYKQYDIWRDREIGRTRADREKQAPGIVSAALNNLETYYSDKSQQHFNIALLTNLH